MLRLRSSRGIEIPGLGIFLEDVSTLVVADLHIGYEEALEVKGIHIPVSQYPRIKKELEAMIKRTNPERIVLVGDVKHEFGDITRQEWNELIDLFRFLKEEIPEVHVVRGNHDNFLVPIIRKFGARFHEEGFLLDYVYFTHGHKELLIESLSAELIVIGHEHPAIAIRDDLGVKHKFKCLLHGDYGDKELIVLPAISPFMPGTEINAVTANDLLSPILRRCDLLRFRVYVIDPDIGVYDFGKLEYLIY